ncbi:helix-hairpin-helix domain-containing protein [Halorubrum sp. RMP-47]|uniref:helix-hairpin-helix domain-containing protein n=1 Tax=Halorubrum miltondacostae TaxID=3076378 RepID=UPI0035289887
MILTAAIVLILIALVTQSIAWFGLAALVYFLGVGVAVIGWSLEAASAILPAPLWWSSALLSLVTGPFELPVWQPLVVATVLIFAAAGNIDDESETAGDTTDDATSASDSVRAPNVEELPGVGEQKAIALRDAGYEDADDILAASKTELTDVDGIGTELAARLIFSVKDRYAETDTGNSTNYGTGEKTDGAALSPDTESPDDAADDTPTDKTHTDGEKARLVAGLEATCDRIETLVEAGTVADANNRLPAARAAVSETRDALNTLSSDRKLRLRVNDVENRLDAIPTEAEAQYHDLIADGDARVTTAQEAVETGDIETGLEACENAHAMYRSARQVGQTANGQWFTDEQAALNSRITSVEALTDRLEHEREVQQAEATIDTLTQRISSLKETSELGEAEDVIQSIVVEGNNALARLPNDITTPELERRVTHLREQVTEFETIAEHLAAQSASAPSDTPSEPEPETASSTGEEAGDSVASPAAVPDDFEDAEPTASERSSDGVRDPEESNSVVRTVDELNETPQHTAPVVLQIREQLTEDGRRHVFRAETGDGKSVQLDVWNRHVSEFDWEPDAWYVFKNVRGQHWTVNGESGVTVSTTPDVTVTQRDSGPDADAAAG